MIAINPAGISACLTPGVRGSNGTYTCDVYLMVGDMPPAEFLEEITSATELVTNFPQVTLLITIILVKQIWITNGFII